MKNVCKRAGGVFAAGLGLSVAVLWANRGNCVPVKWQVVAENPGKQRDGQITRSPCAKETKVPGLVLARGCAVKITKRAGAQGPVFDWVLELPRRKTEKLFILEVLTYRSPSVCVSRHSGSDHDFTGDLAKVTAQISVNLRAQLGKEFESFRKENGLIVLTIVAVGMEADERSFTKSSEVLCSFATSISNKGTWSAGQAPPRTREEPGRKGKDEAACVGDLLEGRDERKGAAGGAP